MSRSFVTSDGVVADVLQKNENYLLDNYILQNKAIPVGVFGASVTDAIAVGIAYLTSAGGGRIFVPADDTHFELEIRVHKDRNGAYHTNFEYHYDRQPTVEARPYTDEEWQVGDTIFNSQPSIDKCIGWVCTTAGTPGTWTPFGYTKKWFSEIEVIDALPDPNELQLGRQVLVKEADGVTRMYFCISTTAGTYSWVEKILNGKSAYELAVDDGFEGTEEEWILSLNGSTPIRGTDYWTENDKDEIISELSDNETLIYNVAEVVKAEVPLVKTAEQPTFVSSIDEMTDTSKVYVLATDMHFYAYIQHNDTEILTTADFTVGSVGTNGLPNISSSLKTRIYTKILPLENSKISITLPSGYQFLVYFYNTDSPTETSNTTLSEDLAGKTTWLGANVNNVTNLTCSTGSTEGATHCRISFKIDDTTDLTDYFDDFVSNSPITIEKSGVKEWVDTGYAYNQPEDYEARIVALENALGGIAYGTY